MLDRFVDVVALYSCVNTSKIRRNANNSKEPQQKYRLGMVSMKILGGGLKLVLRVPNLALGFCHGSKQLSGPHEGFLTHQWIITGNK